ncbi:hypothetical protein CRUP_004263 [Coryphaenoides rupestris]|nr:hypothetical protein CRUP_004263 [Coryphaenoides rupestris]
MNSHTSSSIRLTPMQYTKSRTLRGILGIPLNVRDLVYCMGVSLMDEDVLLNLSLSSEVFPEQDLIDVIIHLKDFHATEGGGPATSRALEVVEGNVRWLRLHQRHLFQWLHEANESKCPECQRVFQKQEEEEEDESPRAE